MKLFRAFAQDVAPDHAPDFATDTSLWPLPRPRSGGHDVIATDESEGVAVVSPAATDAIVRALPVQAAQPPQAVLSPDVERRLAHLAGVDVVPAVAVDDDHEAQYVAADASADFSHRLLRVAQLAAVGAMFLVMVAAVVAARFGSASLRVHELPLAAWGLGAALSAVALASHVGDPAKAARTTARRRFVSAGLTLSLLVAVSGLVACAGGVGGPAWVLFVPVVIVAGAVLGPVGGLSIGALAAAGIYAAAGISHTLTFAGAGRLIVILPACPAAGWAAGSLARLAREAAADAAARRRSLEDDVRRLSEVLDAVAQGDLTRVPAPGEGADPVATSLAVVFADTLLALRRLVRQMESVTEQVAGSASGIAATAEQHVAGVESQTAAVSQTTSTIEELAATAAAIADISVHVSQYAGSTRLNVEAGGQAVQDANDAMDRIATRVEDLSSRAHRLSERIAKVGTTTLAIDELARRTAILSVNASIEAARAGDHGRGFATVAHEVDTLAARAREATARIAAIVQELEQEAAATAEAGREGLAAVEVGTQLQSDVVTSLRRIAAMVDHTTSAAHEITEATRQQRVASDAVVAAMATVTESGERHRSGTHGYAESATRLRDLAADLKSTLGRFTVG